MFARQNTMLDKYKKWIFQMFEKYKSVLFLEKYNVKVEKSEEGDYLASKFNYPYLDLKILYSEESFSDWKKNQIDAERRLIHEFCHTITDPFYCVAIDRCVTRDNLEQQRERLTDHIAQIVNKHFNLLK